MPTYPWSKQETKETTKKVADKKTSYPWDKPSETKNEVTPIVKKPIPKMTPAQKKVYAEELGLNPKEPLVIPKSPSKQLVVGKGVKKNVVPQGKIISSGLNKVNNPIISGLGKGVMATLDAVGSAFQAPATIAVRGGEGYQNAVDNGKNGLLGTIKGIGTGINDVLKRENTVQNTQLIETVAPKTTTDLKAKYPQAYNIISTLADFIGVDDMFAIGLAGDISKVMKLNNMPASTADLNRLFSKIQSNAPLTAVEKAIVNENPEIVNAIKKPKVNKYSTMTTQISQNKPDAYLDEYLDTIGDYEKEWLHPTKINEMQPVESVVNKVSTVRGKDPSSKYFRFTQKDEPMSNWGHAMFSDDISKVSSDGITSSSYGDHGWSYDGKDAVHIDKLKSKIKKAWEHDIKNGFSGDFAGNTIGDDAYQNMSWEEVYNSFNPDNIVDFADGYDNELNQWLWERIIEPNDIKAIKTSDGAVVFNNDDSIIKKLADSQRQFTPSTTTQKGLQQVQKQLPTPVLKLEGKNLPSITQPQTLRIKKPIEAPKPLSNINTQPIVKSGLKPIVATPKVAQISFDEFKSMVTKKGSVSGRGEYALYLNGKQLTQFDSPSYEKAYQDYLKQQFSINEAIARRSVAEAPLKPNLAAQEVAAITSLKAPKAKTIEEAVSNATTKKDISGFQAYTTDVYRNFEQVFKEDFDTVKKSVLDPFDAAKKSKAVEDKVLMTDLKKNIVDRFNIQKGSKDSALVQQFGEKRIEYDALVKQVGKAKADNIVEADKYFRSTYDKLIDEVNVARAKVYPNNAEKIIPKRTDYYRHFKEMDDSFGGLKNAFETPSQISPALAGMSEFTKPRTKFLSFAQKRGAGEFTDDAVGGFLNYINAATYAKHIDTQIPNFRKLGTDLAKSTEKSANMNNFIGYLTDFTNDLSGKTNPADRFMQKIIPGGRTTMKALNWLNSRVKANTVLGNLSSTLSQIANVPQGIAYVKNPIHLTKGAGNFMASLVGKGDNALYKQSGFILERYSDNMVRQFDVKILDQPKKVAAWMLGALDEVGTKFIWSSTYQKALADGIEVPIKYADDITRKMVAGRGIGEVPLLQKSKIMQLVAPFTIEVNNLWKVQKDFVKAKDFGGLAMLYLANFVLNKGMEEVRGSGVVFDPINAMADAYGELTQDDIEIKAELESKQTEYNKITNKNLDKAKTLNKQIDELKSNIKTPLQKAGLAAGRLGGEVISNTPVGSSLIELLYPEQGINNELVSLPTRKKLFGRNDPTRFGSGLLAVKGLQDPLYKVLPSFGGGQIKKTVQAGQDLGLLPKLKKKEGKLLPTLEKQKLPASYSNTKQGDRLRTTINPTLSTNIKGLAFGRGAIPEVKKYYESGKTPLGTTQTENIKKLFDKGYDPNKLFKALNSIRGTSKKEEIVVKLRQSGYNGTEIKEIWEIFYK